MDQGSDKLCELKGSGFRVTVDKKNPGMTLSALYLGSYGAVVYYGHAGFFVSTVGALKDWPPEALVCVGHAGLSSKPPFQSPTFQGSAYRA